jgi:hypothetical protein
LSGKYSLGNDQGNSMNLYFFSKKAIKCFLFATLICPKKRMSLIKIHEKTKGRQGR